MSNTQNLDSIDFTREEMALIFSAVHSHKINQEEHFTKYLRGGYPNADTKMEDMNLVEYAKMYVKIFEAHDVVLAKLRDRDDLRKSMDVNEK